MRTTADRTKEIFAANLRRIRKDRGITMQELANKTGLSKMSICYYENIYTVPKYAGYRETPVRIMPTQETLEKLAAALATTVKELLKETKPDVGWQIRTARKKLHLTQTELAERTGTSQNVVSRWELNQATPNRTSRKRLEEALHCELRTDLRQDRL